LRRDLKDGPDAAVSRLLSGEATAGDGSRPDAFAALVDQMERQLGASGSLPRAQGIWLYRMILTPHPLQERLTLFWHDHFATSNAKVNNLGLMQRQIALLRRHALGSFPTLLTEIAKDPAMLIWLDATANRKAHPNENYAREVMELFTLGRGHYAEKDVQEAARAFTGAFIQGGRYEEIASQHDDGQKTILGRSGRFRGDDVARLLLEQDACAAFLCRKLYHLFVHEVDEPSNDLIAPLAEAFRSSGYQIETPVRMILRSRLFFERSVRGRRVKSPVEYAVGLLRALEIVRPTVGTEALAEACSRMGQGLYAPPSVAGWDGGTAWINTTTSLARTNLALALLSDDDPAFGGRLDITALTSRHGVSGLKETVRFLADLLWPDGLDAESLRVIREQAAAPGREPRFAARQAATLILTSPKFQLA
jgi:uncharacterized protein (DUF1800 family)